MRAPCEYPFGSARTDEGFGASARRLSGLAGVLLGWTPDAFWRATPEELAAVIEALAGEEPQPASGSDLRYLMERFPDG